MLSSVGAKVPTFNWEIPAFPVDDLNSGDSTDKHISIPCFTRRTQTEPKDWALLQLRQFSDHSNEDLDTESSDGEETPTETMVDPNRNLLKVMLHKGTFTCDFPEDLTREQKLEALRQKFPKAEDNHLNEILDACLEDCNWAEKVLSELNDDQFDVRALELLPSTSEPSTSSPDLDSESTSNEDEYTDTLSYHNQTQSVEEQEFVLTLTPSLAAHLQSQFGFVTDSVSSEDLTITLSHGVARLLHHSWKTSLNQKPLKTSNHSIAPQTQSIDIYQINSKLVKKTVPTKDVFMLPDSEGETFGSPSKDNGQFRFVHKSKNVSNDTKKSLDFERNVPKSELQEIMDLELAKALSLQEYDQSLEAAAAQALKGKCPTQRFVAKELLSTRLKRDQLYQRYPGIDQNFLDTIFESNNYLLGQTINVLDNSMGLCDDFSKETEQLIADEGYAPPSSFGNSKQPWTALPTKPVRKNVNIKSVLADMNALLEKKHEYHNKTQIAFQRKMYAVASYYGDEATQLQKKIESLSNDIVDTILNNSSNSNELDLHGLHIREVNSILAEYLRRKSEELRKTPGKRRLCIDIITGYGATKGVQGSIKPLVIQYLKQKSLPFEMVNMGLIRVTLTQ